MPEGVLRGMMEAKGSGDGWWYLVAGYYNMPPNTITRHNDCYFTGLATTIILCVKVL
jgi:hypothetical protein